MNNRIQETAQFSVTLKPKLEWDALIAEVKAKGDRLSSDMKAQGHAFEPAILAPTATTIKNFFISFFLRTDRRQLINLS